MKKIFALIMLAGTLSFVACNSEKKAEEATEETAPATEETTAPAEAPATETAPADSPKTDATTPAPAGEEAKKEEAAPAAH